MAAPPALPTRPDRTDPTDRPAAPARLAAPGRDPGAPRWRVITLHAGAPPKPAPGRPCNGCGVCCAAEPCPLGMLLSRRRHGACAALAWDEAGRRYLCGALERPPALLGWLPPRLARALVTRWIGAQRGCDSELEAA